MSVTKADLGNLLGQMVSALNQEFKVAKEYETAPSAAVLNTTFALIKHFDITPDVDDVEAKKAKDLNVAWMQKWLNSKGAWF